MKNLWFLFQADAFFTDVYLCRVHSEKSVYMHAEPVLSKTFLKFLASTEILL